MGHVVCVTSGLAGLRLATCCLLQRLAKAGHQVTYASASPIGEEVEAQGIRFVPLAPSAMEVYVQRDLKLSKWARLRTRRRRRREAVAAHRGDEFLAVMRELNPDLLLIDIELHHFIIPAVGNKYPLGLLVQWMSIWKHPRLPPLHKPIIPGQGYRGGRLWIELEWLRYRLWKMRKRWSERVEFAGIDWMAVLREQAHEFGFAFDRETDCHQWLIPVTYRSIPSICIRGFELEFPHQPHDNAHYVGPMVDLYRPEARGNRIDQERLTKVLKCRISAGSRQRLVFCGVSSHFASEPEFLRRLVSSFDGQADWDLVVGLGGKVVAQDLGDVPPNVHLFHWVPQMEVLRHADLAIIHGGINTVDECVLAGVPMLVYCAGFVDMPGTTARVVYHGLGMKGDRCDDAETIRLRVSQVMEDPRMRESVELMRDRYLVYEREQRLERTVEQLILQNPL